MSCKGEQAVTTRLVIDTLASRYKFKVELSSFPSFFHPCPDCWFLLTVVQGLTVSSNSVCPSDIIFAFIADRDYLCGHTLFHQCLLVFDWELEKNWRDWCLRITLDIALTSQQHRYAMFARKTRASLVAHGRQHGAKRCWVSHQDQKPGRLIV